MIQLYDSKYPTLYYRCVSEMVIPVYGVSEGQALSDWIY